MDINPIRTLKIKVSNLYNLDTTHKPLFETQEVFVPIEISNYINVTDNNLFTSNAIIKEPFNKFYKIQVLETIFDKNSLSIINGMFNKFEQKKYLLSIIPKLGFILEDTPQFHGGADFIINDKYMISGARLFKKEVYLFEMGLKFNLF